MGKAKKLEMRVVETEKQKARFDRMLHDEHYLEAGRPVGDYLRQVAVRNGQWVGLLAWGACSYALADRDQWIGWTPPLRAARQKLLVQNRRFLIPHKARAPNLASQVLAAAVEALPQQWLSQFGYTPLLAESFTDIELFAGTCYRAAGWLPIGITKGYSRHRADFYHFHRRPKKLWIKPLGGLSPEELRSQLCGPLSPACRLGALSSAAGLLPIPAPQVYSLVQALQRLRDPRRSNRRFRCGTVLAIVAMALLSGHRNLSEIHRFGQRLKPKHRARLGLPRNRRYPKLHETPSYKVYYNLLKKLPLDQFAQTLTDWLQARRHRLPSRLAMDGKMIRELIGVLSVSDHDTGVPVALAIQTEKKGQGDRCELQVGKRMIRDQAHLLDQGLLSGDALHTQKPNAINVAEAGGHYLLQVRDNQPKLQRLAAAKAAATPLLPSSMKSPLPAPA